MNLSLRSGLDEARHDDVAQDPSPAEPSVTGPKAVVPPKRRKSKLTVAGSAALALLLVVLAGYGLWTVYENTLTPAAVDHGSATDSSPSPAGELSATAARALVAYGGEAVWKNATSIDSRVTVGGLLFQLKGVNIPPHARITVDVQRPHTVIDPVDPSGDVGVLDGFSVQITAPDGRVLEQRADARQHLQNASVSTAWDRLNLLYFLGYAFWGYYTLPYQLTRTDIRWSDLRDGVL